MKTCVQRSAQGVAGASRLCSGQFARSWVFRKAHGKLIRRKLSLIFIIDVKEGAGHHTHRRWQASHRSSWQVYYNYGYFIALTSSLQAPHLFRPVRLLVHQSLGES